MIPIEIWYPRYSTDDCCIVASHIRSDSEVYSIRFTKAKTHKGEVLEGKRYVMRGHEIKKLSKKERTKQGNKLVYSVPMGILLSYKQKEQ